MNNSVMLNSIRDALNEKVQSISKENWVNDECPPEFKVTALTASSKGSLNLAIFHLGSNIKIEIYPNPHEHFSGLSLEEAMRLLYNRTM